MVVCGVARAGVRGELATIRDVILEVAGRYGVEVERIILFGSRARGDSREDSDWDILIVTRGGVGGEVLDRFAGEVERKLVYMDVIPEVIVVDRETFEKYKKPAYVFYYAEREGIEIR